MKKETKRIKQGQPPEQQESVDRAYNHLEFRHQDLKINIKKLKCHKEGITIEGDCTLAAFKNPTSYAIGTTKGGLKVIENSIEIYSGVLTFEYNDSGIFSDMPFSRYYKGYGEELQDIVYIDHLDCYLLNFAEEIHRKDIDGSEVYLFMDISHFVLCQGSFLYSKLNRKLVVCTVFEGLSIINLDRKQVEITLKDYRSTKIKDFKMFGLKENKIVYLTKSSLIKIYSVSYDLKKICNRRGHRLARERFGNHFVTIEVCGQVIQLIFLKINW